MTPEQHSPKHARHNAEAERAVLGSLMVNSSELQEVRELISPPDFVDRRHRRIFEVICRAADQDRKLDLLTIRAILLQSGRTLDGACIRLLPFLSDGVAVSSNVTEYARIVREQGEELERQDAGALVRAITQAADYYGIELLRTEDPEKLALGASSVWPELQANLAGFIQALTARGIRIRYNARAAKDEVSERGGAWKPLTDRWLRWLRTEIERDHKKITKGGDGPALVFGKVLRDEFTGALLHIHKADPFEEWLRSLPEWDGRARLSRLLQDCFTAEGDALTRWAGFGILGGAVMRCLTPGAKLDESVILVGPGGSGKSSFTSGLLPPAHPEWHGDSAPLTAEDKVLVESLLGRVIVELSELTGMRRAEQERVKAFLSRRDDGGIRLAYRRDPEYLPRRVVFVGTSDKDQPLPADRNLRRFVTIPVSAHPSGARHVREWLGETRAQLWAEALALVEREKRTPNLPDELKPAQAAQNAAFRLGSSAEDDLEDWIARHPDRAASGVSIAEIAEAVGRIGHADEFRKLNPREQHIVQNVANVCGFVNRRVRRAGVLRRLWFYEGKRPPAPEPDRDEELGW